MTGDALAEMEHKHVLDTICRINGRQPWGVSERGDDGGREGGRMQGSRKYCVAAAWGGFKHHHRVWLRHWDWKNVADQRLFKQLSFSFLFCFFPSFFELSYCDLLRERTHPHSRRASEKCKKNKHQINLILNIKKRNNCLTTCIRFPVFLIFCLCNIHGNIFSFHCQFMCSKTSQERNKGKRKLLCLCHFKVNLW